MQEDGVPFSEEDEDEDEGNKQVLAPGMAPRFKALLGMAEDRPKEPSLQLIRDKLTLFAGGGTHVFQEDWAQRLLAREVIYPIDPTSQTSPKPLGPFEPNPP